jgi:hypothetical protein
MLLGCAEVWWSLTAEVPVQRLQTATKMGLVWERSERKTKKRCAMTNGSSLSFGAVILYVDATFLAVKQTKHLDQSF